MIGLRYADAGCSDTTQTEPIRGVYVRVGAASVRVAAIPMSQEVEDECS